jgi:hypothetical protein
MVDLCRLIFAAVVDLFRPRAAVGAEILVLRQQIIVALSLTSRERHSRNQERFRPRLSRKAGGPFGSRVKSHWLI